MLVPKPKVSIFSHTLITLSIWPSVHDRLLGCDKWPSVHDRKLHLQKSGVY